MTGRKWAWIAAGSLFGAPYLLVVSVGFLWLYQESWLWLYLIIALVCSTAGWSMLRWLRKRNTISAKRKTDPLAPVARQQAEEAVAEIADRMRHDVEQYDRMELLWPALREVLEAVAKVYHPRSREPVLETPAPHVLRIVELVSHDLRHEMNERIPAAHALTLNDIQRLGRLGVVAQQLYNVYRIGSFLISPQTALWREARDYMSGESYSVASLEARRWAIGFAVRRAGEYAIQLYSGEMLLDDLAPEKRITSRSKDQIANDRRRNETEVSEPLRMLVIGQTKAGKSSLINALFGKTVAAVGPAPLTDEVTAYQLQREGVLEGLVLDSPGYEVVAKKPKQMREALMEEIEACDIVLLVCSATSAARAADRELLDSLRERFEASPQRTPPSLLVVLTHIDLLRPRNEWNPPYNIADPVSPKGQTIRDCMQAVADDLALPVEQITPVCLAPDMHYNVNDALAAAIAGSLDDAHRAKYFRCLSDLREGEFWRRMGEQAKASGKMLARMGIQWLSEAGRKFDDWSREPVDGGRKE